MNSCSPTPVATGALGRIALGMGLRCVLFGLASGLLGTPAALAADGGPPSDAGRASLDGTAVGGDAGGGAAIGSPAAWRAARIAELRARRERLRQLALRLKKLDQLDLPGPLAQSLAVDLEDPAATARRIVSLAREIDAARWAARESAARLSAATPGLQRPAEEVARRKRRAKRGHRRPKIDGALAERARVAAQRLALMRLEHEVGQARVAMLQGARRYLEATQARRVQAHRQRLERDEKQQAERETSERMRRQASAERQAAELARQAALAAQRIARSETERLLAGERARLEGVRGQQARFKQRLAQRSSRMVRQRRELERFRGELARRAEELGKRWPQTAARYDALYDVVVAHLEPLRPQARSLLLSLIRGLPAPPAPAPIDRRLEEVDALYRKEVGALDELRGRLQRAGEQLDRAQLAQARTRLELLSREVTWLNDHRTRILERVTSEKYDSLTGLSRATIAQGAREIGQLVFDVLYWLYLRSQQLDRIPKLVVDIFTVGALLWKVIKLIALLLLLRWVLRRWDRWTQRAVRQVGRTVALGRFAPLVAKVIDSLRHAGRPLLVLIAGVLVYRMLGDGDGPPELRVAYDVFFWIVCYRLLMRFVESVAKYAGLERALRAADSDDPFELDEMLEGPLEQQQLEERIERAREQRRRQQAGEGVIPASVLLVRSVRATMRYVLVVVLTLELTSDAVGRGTIYGLTAKFSWLAALPFVFYFLKLWRPHIVRAYHGLTSTARDQTLWKLVEKSQDRSYGVFVIGAAFGVVFGNRLAGFTRRYLFSLDATKRLLALLFRRQVARRAQELGRVVAQRQELARELLAQFPTGPLEPRDRPIPPPQMAALREAFSIWHEQQRDGSTALVGHAGMGKTTMLRLLEREIGAPVLSADLRTKIIRPARVVSWLSEVFGFSPKPSSEKELVRMIREDTRPVVALDDCHNLFLRQVNGFAGWEAFGRIVNQTSDNVFWLMTFAEPAWDYLHNVSGRIDLFRRVIELRPWTEQTIRRLLLSRTYRARYRVSFSDLVMTQLDNVDLSVQLGRTSEGYFRMIWDFADGNPRIAGQLWLDSLVPVDEERAVRVHLFKEPSIGQLAQMPDKMAFVLTAVAEHDNLTAEQAARATNLELDFCRFAFRHFLEDGYLVPIQGTKRMRLALHWQQPILRFLRRRHLLHDSS